LVVIAIIDYGVGNLRSVQKGFERVGHQAVITSDPKTIASADAVVLPGVGAFRACMDNLKSSGLVRAVYRAIDSGKPFLGICVGMQILFSECDEFGPAKGLGVFGGPVVRFPETVPETGEPLKVPHMGWNSIRIRARAPIFAEVAQGSYLYFVHSYYPEPSDPGLSAATTTYGVEFTSAIWQDAVFATQFHPEKSQRVGLQILKSFGDLLR
jgi:glutamine amidotransferase